MDCAAQSRIFHVYPALTWSREGHTLGAIKTPIAPAGV